MARSQREAGIFKAVCETFYMNDWLADGALRSASPAVRGVWIDTLCLMWRDRLYAISKTEGEWASFWGVSAETAKALIQELGEHGVCEVLQAVTPCREMSRLVVTLVSRRLKRREKVRKQAQERKRRQRGHSRVTPGVTGATAVPSSSLSSSSAPSPSGIRAKEQKETKSAPSAGSLASLPGGSPPPAAQEAKRLVPILVPDFLKAPQTGETAEEREAKRQQDLKALGERISGKKPPTGAEDKAQVAPGISRAEADGESVCPGRGQSV